MAQLGNRTNSVSTEPNSVAEHECGSALLQKADISCGGQHVGFGPMLLKKGSRLSANSDSVC
jgi:hypothetical protein